MKKQKSELPVMPGMGRPDVAGMLQRRMNASLKPGQAQKGTDGLALFGDQQLDLADTKPRRYRFYLSCPGCGAGSETECDQREPAPVVNCGDCLMDRTEIVAFKVVGVEVLK